MLCRVVVCCVALCYFVFVCICLFGYVVLCCLWCVVLSCVGLGLVLVGLDNILPSHNYRM